MQLKDNKEIICIVTNNTRNMRCFTQFSTNKIWEICKLKTSYNEMESFYIKSNTFLLFFEKFVIDQ